MVEKEYNFLVILDDSEEMFKALKYAALRSNRTGGRVILLYKFETLDFSHWKAVEDIAEVESRDYAKLKIKDYENYLMRYTDKEPKKYIMKGDRIECIIDFLSSNKFISNFVLSASPSSSGPGQLITAFTGKYRSKIKVPLTIIPSHLSEEEIDNLS